MSEHVNVSVLRGLSDVFGSDRDSDCVVVFCRDENAPTPAETPSTPAPSGQEGGGAIQRATGDGSAASEEVFGEPLPAHRLILRLASERFAAQLERWPMEGTGRVTEPSEAGPPAGAAMDRRPQLRIPLGSEAEVPAARTAIRFAYTGEVAADISVREVLEVRRQGAYLQIKGCSAACDRALESKLKGSAAQPSTSAGAGSNKRARTTVWPAVQELYECEALWPDPQADPRFAAILTLGKRLLVAHFGNALQTLNLPSLRTQLLALPAVALEALLESDDFGTDSESTVLLQLAVWMEANHGKTDAKIRQRLCRTVRLAHLGRPYLGLVLPALAADHEKDPEGPAGWFSGASVMGAAFISNFGSASECERQRLLSASQGSPSIAASLKAINRTHCIPLVGGLTYSWTITKEELQRALGLLEPGVNQTVCGTFNQPLSQDELSAWGFEWRVLVQLTSGQPSAGLFLQCDLPDALELPGSRLSGEASLADFAVVPTSARLTVHRRQWGAQSNVNVQNTLSSSEDFVQVGYAWGWDEVLPLREQQQQPPVAAGGTTAAVAAVDPLAAWVDYLLDDKITGTLTLLRNRPSKPPRTLA